MDKQEEKENIKLDFLEKNENMTTYYYYKRFLSDEQIEEIKRVAQNYSIIDGNVSGVINKSYRSSQIRWIPLNKETHPIYETFLNLAKKANQDMWNFTITDMLDELQFTEYRAEDEGHYDWHMDFGGRRTSTRKLSMVVQLTDPEEYKGGKLQFFLNRDIITAPKEKGTVIFFPSYLTHRVTKIEEGTRNSLVCWFHGPPFK